MKTQIAALLSIIGASVCFAAQPIPVDVLFREPQLRKPEVPGTTQTIMQAFRPSLATNLVTSESHLSLSPLQFYLSVFGPKPPGIEWMSGMDVLRFQTASTNFVVMERFRFKELKMDTNFVSRLQPGDVLFYHGCVD